MSAPSRGNVITVPAAYEATPAANDVMVQNACNTLSIPSLIANTTSTHMNATSPFAKHFLHLQRAYIEGLHGAE